MEQSLGDMEEGQALTGSGEQKLYYQGRENDMLTGSLHVVDTTLVRRCLLLVCVRFTTFPLSPLHTQQTAYESFESLLRQKDVFKGACGAQFSQPCGTASTHAHRYPSQDPRYCFLLGHIEEHSTLHREA
uniref:Cation-independent mannose-6-phosphate receptor n=1 Tax=Lygus hesperus TaxID=30085 RepID=A0A0A9WZ16_LYGHE